jgi:hypothetical protein
MILQPHFGTLSKSWTRKVQHAICRSSISCHHVTVASLTGQCSGTLLFDSTVWGRRHGILGRGHANLALLSGSLAHSTPVLRHAVLRSLGDCLAPRDDHFSSAPGLKQQSDEPLDDCVRE